MSKIKVIHICDKFGVGGSTIHGVSRLLEWWFQRFDRDRFDVKLYGLKSPDPASRSLEDQGLGMSYMGGSALNPLTLRTFLNVIRREQADVLHLHGWIAANYGRVAGRIAGVPTIMHEHGVDPKFPASQRMADRMLSPFTHTAVAVSRSVAAFLAANRSVPASKIRIVYNGAPIGDFQPPDPRKVGDAREEFGIPEGTPVIGAIGRLDTQKGITYLLQASRAVLEEMPDARFLIVGDGPKKEELEQEAETLGLGHSITFAGHRSDVPVVQSLLDIQAFPSLWEGAPLTIFEAMAMGMPIVSTDVDGLGEVLSHEQTALIVKPADPDGLARSILRLLRDRELADRLATSAKDRSWDHDIQHCVDRLEALYEELHGGS
jgi:glycosyltransferase involved in cell wall biosynthesis